MGAISNTVLVKALRALERWLYRSAAHVITVSPDMEAHVRQAAPAATTSTVEYGTEFDLVDAITSEQVCALRNQYDLPASGVVLYAGTFGRANAIPTLIRAARRLQHRSDVCFVFAGQGYYASTIREAADALPNIRLVPPQPRLRSLALFRLADVSITSFVDRPVLGTNSPSKLYDSLAVGTPVIVTNPGWMQRLVQAHGCGWYVPPEQPETLAQKVAALFDRPAAIDAAGIRAAAIARDRFDRAQHMDRIAELVDAVGRASRP